MHIYMIKDRPSGVGIREIVGNQNFERYVISARNLIWKQNAPEAQRATLGISAYPQLVYFLSRISDDQRVKVITDKNIARQLGFKVINFDQGITRATGKFAIGASLLTTSRMIANDYMSG